MKINIILINNYNYQIKLIRNYLFSNLNIYKINKLIRFSFNNLTIPTSVLLIY